MNISVVRALTYLKSLYQLMRNHYGKLLTFEEIVARHEVCVKCPKYTGKYCSLCGCDCQSTRRTYMNKLAFPNESCPDDPPRWKAKE